jgi:hypothetical protein
VALAPLREAADSLAKASTPQPWSTSKTSNWVARSGGLPDYIQHVSHGIKRSSPGISVSEAIQKAIGVVKRWAAGGGGVDKNTQAAAAKAVAEWEAKKAGAHAGVKEGYIATWADEKAARDGALLELALFSEVLGTSGMIGLLAEGVLAEAAAWTPTLKRVASAPREVERHEVYDGSQHVGTIAHRRGGLGARTENRHSAFAVNGSELTDYGTSTRADALSALQKHLEEAPARVISLPTAGKFLVASPQTYSGETTYKQFSSEPAARHAAGLPATPSVPEINSSVEKVAENLRFDLMTVSGMDIPPLRAVQEARRADPFELLTEAFHADELRGFGGKWVGHGATKALASRSADRDVPGVPVAKVVSTALSSGPRGSRPIGDERYAGGVRRMSQETRSKLMNAFTPAERGAAKTPQPHTDVGKLFETAKPRQAAFERILDLGKGISKRLGASVQSTATPEDFEKAKRDIAANPDKPHVIVAAMKGKARATDKVNKKYGGDASRLTDVVRGTVLVPHVDDLPKAIEAIRAELPKGWTISHPENRYVHGAKGDKVNVGTTSGYRDIAVLLRAPDGFQSELQINTTHMWLAKEVQGGHGTYEVTRAIHEQAHSEGRDLTPTEAQRIKAALSAGRELYDRANMRSARPRRGSASVRPGHAGADAAAALKRGEPTTIEAKHAAGLVNALHSKEGVSSLHMLEVKGHPNLFRANAKNLPRSAMPQIPKEHLPGFMDYLREKRVTATVKDVAPTKLQATQNQLNGAAVARLAKDWNPERQGMMLTSREGHVLDGHHRWAAGAFHELSHPGYTVPTMQFSAGTDRILQLMHQYNEIAGVSKRAFGEHQAAV